MGEMASIAAVGTSAAGSAAGGALGNAMMGGGNGAAKNADYVNQTIQNMNNILGGALNTALQYSNNYTGAAIDEQNKSLQDTVTALTGYLPQATAAATQATQQGLAQSQAINSPYTQAGYGAVDKVQDLLGLSRPTQGSAGIAQANQTLANLQPYLQNLQTTGQAANINGQSLFDPNNKYTAPNAPQAPTLASLAANISSDTAYNNISGAWDKGGLSGVANKLGPDIAQALQANGNNYSPGIIQQVQQEMAAQQYAQAQKDFNSGPLAQYNQQVQQQQGLFNNYQNAYSQLGQQLQGINPQQIQTALAYQQGLFK